MSVVAAAVWTVLLTSWVDNGGSFSSTYAAPSAVAREMRAQVQTRIRESASPLQRGYRVGAITCSPVGDEKLGCHVPLVFPADPSLNSDQYLTVDLKANGGWSVEPS
jgi:hypothetical protein